MTMISLRNQFLKGGPKVPSWKHRGEPSRVLSGPPIYILDHLNEE